MKYNSNNSAINRIAFAGNYLPRQCGIATFTTDLCEAVANEYRDTSCLALPVNDVEAGYAYPPRVRFELAEKDIDSYRRAADFLNINSVDLICLQHEYGIFGGPARPIQPLPWRQVVFKLCLIGLSNADKERNMKRGAVCE